MTENKVLTCSFCLKRQDEVKRIISGKECNICDECVAVCTEAISQQEEVSNKEQRIDLVPREIFVELKNHVIGQERAKKVLSVAVYNHYKRLKSKSDDGIEIDKSNILMIGPTGCGKTLLAQTLAKILHVPFAIADATTLTEAGYVGEDVENILVRLVQAADGDLGKAENGIIYIDEIDKISRKSENLSITRDVSGEGVQQALLKLMEGTVASIPPQGGRKHPHQEMLQVDTKNILFICSGAFSGLEKVIKQRKDSSSIGFEAHISEKNLDAIDGKLLFNVEPEDLVKYGLIPEFIGRLPQIVTIEPMTEDMLVRVLNEPKNSLIKQYQKLFSLHDVSLSFDKEAQREIAKEAIKRKTGARGLRSIIESILLETMFVLPGNDNIQKVEVDVSAVKNLNNPQIIRKKQKRKAI